MYIGYIHCVLKNWGTHSMPRDSLSYMWINFDKHFTVTFSDELQKTLNKISHLTSNLLPHYHLGEFECSTEQLYSTLFNANVM